MQKLRSTLYLAITRDYDGWLVSPWWSCLYVCSCVFVIAGGWVASKRKPLPAAAKFGLHVQYKLYCPQLPSSELSSLRSFLRCHSERRRTGIHATLQSIGPLWLEPPRASLSASFFGRIGLCKYVLKLRHYHLSPTNIRCRNAGPSAPS
jgi:hypothetical protein